jgi:hypothetical protein
LQATLGHLATQNGLNNGARVSQIQWLSAISKGVYTKRQHRAFC